MYCNQCLLIQKWCKRVFKQYAHYNNIMSNMIFTNENTFIVKIEKRYQRHIDYRKNNFTSAHILHRFRSEIICVCIFNTFDMCEGIYSIYSKITLISDLRYGQNYDVINVKSKQHSNSSFEFLLFFQPFRRTRGNNSKKTQVWTVFMFLVYSS